MDKELIRQAAAELYKQLPGNILDEAMDILPEHVGTRMFDEPLVGFGGADDALFDEYKKVGVIGPWHMSPAEWLPQAKTVVSLFFPASLEVRQSNRRAKEKASDLWAYARIEGQAFIGSYMAALQGWFRELGVEACVPALDPRWLAVRAGEGIEGYPEIREDTYGSNWSERHAAYVCGLGTFGLSKGLITEKGMAGRFGSILIDAKLAPDLRPYSGIYDYCTRCGACIKRCPVAAIDLEHGKDHTVCGPFLALSRTLLAPRYGCGLCQTGVPCETRIP
ncbi:putative iron-sulfur cluster-binding protein [Slackia heliotrinireducens]|uniref:Uncharacterized Fe-S protein n=1 Tax=Slackia heliotrinireducens (strain ATCC 29202 / DSM 20476 / NCTC 11029 / RHS 1) TaxID=471855 RepID=C7N360_SLAHD|nr:4Fe-4S binding protein [Slackia heliotrinireducens]ACV21581.1 uncharacterized Fe-S protein [Slackia heliotrinireducens DSM 20476]VEG99102.1 putative iron-sulfur cluster-binding protein [Slackia heliotrinireducens]